MSLIRWDLTILDCRDDFQKDHDIKNYQDEVVDPFQSHQRHFILVRVEKFGNHKTTFSIVQV